MPPKNFHYSKNAPRVLLEPWPYLIVFFAANLVLAYSELPISSKLWIGLFGCLIPLVTGVLVYLDFHPAQKSILDGETFPSIPAAGWFALVIFAISIRLYIFLNPDWPIPDDGVNAFGPMELSQKWEWHSFFTTAQVPPLTFWASTLFFKLFGSSIFSIRLYNLIFSLCDALLSYLAARVFFSKSLSFLCLVFAALGFWPLYASRFFAFMQPLTALELACLCLLGNTLSDSTPSGKISWKLFALALLTGLGFWIAIAWPIMAAALAVPLILKFKKKILTPSLFSLSFWLPIFLSFAIFSILSFGQGNGEHIKYLLAFSIEGGWIQRFIDCLSNITSLFWGYDFQNSYGPVWGGMLNPLEGALFFLGVFELIRSRFSRQSLWVLSTLFIFILPGLITNTFEIFRNSLEEPILPLTCALGTRWLLSRLPVKNRLPGLALIICVIAPLNTLHLLRTYSPEEPPFFSRAFNILGQTARKEGPGLIFMDLQPNKTVHTLALAVHSFNAAENLSLDPSSARWIAFLENSNYKSFLARRFPNGHWYEMGPDPFWGQGNMMLGVIPVESSNKTVFTNWLNMDRLLHRLTREAYFDHAEVHKNRIFKELLEVEKASKQDRFLESVFYENVIFYQKSNLAFPFIQWVQRGIEKGYPAPHLLNAEGVLFLKTGRLKEARAAFLSAVQTPDNSTSAAKNLLTVELLERQKHPPHPLSRIKAP